VVAPSAGSPAAQRLAGHRVRAAHRDATGTEAGHSAPPCWFALALTLAGGPYLAWTLLRIMPVGYDTLTHRQRRAVLGVVAAVALLHPRPTQPTLPDL
jgi:hypothetical protein